MLSLRSTTTGLLISCIALVAGCGDPVEDTTDTADTNDDGGDDDEVTSAITVDTTWSSDKILAGIIYVQDGATLTIEPGVKVFGKSGSALVIAQGAKLEAAGTKEAPIVFTSSQPEGMRAPGDWGGIVFLGKAITNLGGGVGQAEGLEDMAAYGGDDPAYNCGTLKWARVEFAGFELTTDNELNGVTFYSCGTATTVEYVQVHMGQDDGIEWFGGGFDAKHIVISGAQDDSLDIDQGFSGTLQYLLLQQDPGVGNYCFEVSNQDISLDAPPRTAPKVCNATCIGTGSVGDTKSAGIKLKEGASGEFHSSLFLDFKAGIVDLTDEATEKQATAGAIKISNDLFFKPGDPVYVTSSDFDLKAFIEDPAAKNQIDVDPQLSSTTWGSTDIAPRAGSPALVAGDTVDGCEATDYLGAVKDSASDWTLGWTNWALN